LPKRVSNPPDAQALMNGARSIGNYDLAAAFADLIDNSITAQATWIDILCDYRSGEPFVTVMDNGTGMNAEELLAAMRPASYDPEMDRSKEDLGRFGWGMKSASLSQARSLTVVSRNDDVLSAANWDLDNIKKWEMDIFDEDEAQEILDLDDIGFSVDSGTTIIWKKCDRLGDDGALSQNEFNGLVAEAREKLSLIFHRFLEPRAERRIVLRLNGLEIEGQDPFFTSHKATLPFKMEKINLGANGIMTVQPYILPHYTKLTSEEVKLIDRSEGSNRNQGFYVYRNGRLIINGTWFGIFKHGDLSDLVRVKVDIPNTMDKFWKISIDKNDAKLPASLKRRLRDILQGVKGKSAKVYRTRGARLHQQSSAPVWDKLRKHGKTRYEVNREMPLIANFGSDLSEDRFRQFQAVLSLIEQTLPVMSISSDLSDIDNTIVQEETDEAKANIYLQDMLKIALSSMTGSNKELEEKLFAISFFADKKTMVRELLKGIFDD
jgi:hypothetical protein